MIALRSKDLQQHNSGPLRWLNATWFYPWKMLSWALAAAWILVSVLRVLAM